MATCSKCQHSLDDAEIRNRRCSQCGEPFAGIPDADDESPNGDAKVFAETIDSSFSSEPGEASSEDRSANSSTSKSNDVTIDSAFESVEQQDPKQPLDASGKSDSFFAATIDSSVPGGISSGDASSDADSSSATKRELATLKPDARKYIAERWGSDVDRKSAGMSLRTDGGASGATQNTAATLVIQQRALGETPLEVPENLDYGLEHVIGEGGMGKVYSARQASLNRNVAVKMIKSDLRANPEIRGKFLSEAVITGELEHPGIIPIYDLGASEDGSLFYSMKEIKGQAWMESIHSKTIYENLEVLLKVCDATAFSHSRDIIHRDLKPENIVLGEFGEVMVLDWGMAAYIGDQQQLSEIAALNSLGGTPAYMAPEMASGPLEKIGKQSDIYLLGSLLYFCVTGRPPRHAKSATKCLLAACDNHIEPTETQGELIEIALKAMATDSADRYPTVQEFQRAIREYLSHLESINLASRAEEDLKAAEQSNDYRDYAKSLVAFEEAFHLWPGNTTAKSGIVRAQTAYARSAYQKGDFDLGLSLLDKDDPQHAELIRNLSRAHHEREARQRRLKNAKLAVAALVAVVICGLSIGFVLINDARKQAVLAEEEAESRRKQAVLAEEEAESRRKQAVLAEDKAESRRKEAVAARDEADRRREQAIQARSEAQYEAYVAQIGLAASKIDERAFDQALDLLLSCDPQFRDWEWGRLMHLCRLRDQIQPMPSKSLAESVAISSSGELVAETGASEMVLIRKLDGAMYRSLKLPSAGWSVAFAPHQPIIAVGSAGREDNLRLWNYESDTVVRLDGHTDDVLSVEFSRDGLELLTASKDHTAKRWSCAPDDSRVLTTYVGHSWWVWDATFSHDQRRVVTASEDGTAIVWDTQTGQQEGKKFGERKPFRGHQGAVYAVAFSADPDNPFVVSAGFDRRVLMWSPDQLEVFDYDALIRGEDIRPARVLAELTGHIAAVRALSVSHDGRFILSGSHDNTLKVWAARSQVFENSQVPKGSLLKTLRGHSSLVRSATFSPANSDLIASTGHDDQLRLWSVRGYREQNIVDGNVLRGHADAILAANFSPNGKYAVTASRDRTARSWNPELPGTSQEFREGHRFLVSGGDFFPDGSKIVTAAGDGSVRVWDVDGGNERMAIENTASSGAFALTDDGRWLIVSKAISQTPANAEINPTTTIDERIAMEILDADTGAVLHRLKGHDAEVSHIAVSHDSRLIFSGDANGRGNVWELQTGKLLQTIKSLHTRRISGGVFLEDALRLITASLDNTIIIWDLSDDRPRALNELQHGSSVTSIALVEGERYLLASYEEGICLWDIRSPQPTRNWSWQSPEGHRVTSVAVGKERLAAATYITSNLKSSVLVWDLTSPPDRQKPWIPQSDNQYWATAFSPNDDQLLLLGDDEASLWTLEGQWLDSFSPHRTVSFASYSPDGTRVVTCGWDNTVRIWNVETGKSLYRIRVSEDHSSRVNSAFFSSDGDKLLAASSDGVIRLFDVEHRKQVQTYQGHEGGVTYAGFSPGGDDRFILSSSRDKTARIWDTETGKQVGMFASDEASGAVGHSLDVLHARFSADLRYVVTSSDDMTAIIWDVESKMPIDHLKGHTAAITCATFSPAGTRILTGSSDSTAKLWDVQRILNSEETAASGGKRSFVDGGSSKELLTLRGHQRGVTAVEFSRDGTKALTASRDGTAVVWVADDWENTALTVESGLR